MGKNKSQGLQGGKPDQFSTKRTAKLPNILVSNEGQHADDEPIYPSRFPFAELIPGWDNFDPNTKNPALNKNFASGHHAPGGTGKKRRDFENFTLAVCLEWKQDSEGKWRRCYNQFTVDSDQCTTHPKVQYKDGPNKVYKIMKDGREGNWGMLKNSYIQPEQTPLTPAELEHLRYKEMEVEVVKRCADGQDLGAAWVEVQAQFDEQDRIARKTEKQAARARSSREDGGEQDFENLGLRKLSNQPPPGIAALDEKAKRNPNQRRKTVNGQRQLAPIPEHRAKDELLDENSR
jgi:hypothetical protein